MIQSIKEVTVLCRKAGEGSLVHQRPGKIEDGRFIAGEMFSIRPFETKKMPEDVADALRRDFPSYILTDEEARAEQIKADAALAAKDGQIADLQGQLDEIKALSARMAKGDKKAMAELAKLLASAQVVEDGKPVTKQQPSPAAQAEAVSDEKQ